MWQRVTKKCYATLGGRGPRIWEEGEVVYHPDEHAHLEECDGPVVEAPASPQDAVAMAQMADKKNEIANALRALDPENDGHWTKEGLPLCEAVELIVERTVTRAEIQNAIPGFERPQ